MQMQTDIEQLKQALGKRLVEIVLYEMLAQEHLSEEDLQDKKAIFKKLYEFSQKANFTIVADHRDSILKTAEDFLSTKQYGFSLIFFAMFFEHSINYLITHQFEKKKISKKKGIELIKSANIEAKFSSILEQLEMPKFSQSHKKTIMDIAKERNAYIHYKWISLTDSEESDKHTKTLNLISAVRKSVTYMKTYESRILYANKKKKLKDTLKLPFVG